MNAEVKDVPERALEKCSCGGERGTIEYEDEYSPIRVGYGGLSKMLEERCLQ
jgi:hypothetical protein